MVNFTGYFTRINENDAVELNNLNNYALKPTRIEYSVVNFMSAISEVSKTRFAMYSDNSGDLRADRSKKHIFIALPPMKCCWLPAQSYSGLSIDTEIDRKEIEANKLQYVVSESHTHYSASL